MKVSVPFAQDNNPKQAGELASSKVTFGRYAVYAVHTRFDNVSWFVADAESVDEVTGGSAIIRQESSFETAVAGLE